MAEKVKIAVVNERTGRHVDGYAVKNSDGRDITKFRWDKYDDGFFHANMTICCFDGKIGKGLFLAVVECD